MDIGYKIELPWLEPRLSPNKSTHWAVKSKLRKKQKNAAFWIAKEAGNPPKTDLYHLDIVFHPPGNYGYDADNALAAIKGELDGIALAWGVDDKYFRPVPKFGEVQKPGKIIIKVTPYKPNS